MVKTEVEGEIVAGSLAKNELKIKVNFLSLLDSLYNVDWLVLSLTAWHSQESWSQACCRRRSSNSSTFETFTSSHTLSSSFLVLGLWQHQGSLLHSWSLDERSISPTNGKTWRNLVRPSRHDLRRFALDSLPATTTERNQHSEAHDLPGAYGIFTTLWGFEI